MDQQEKSSKENNRDAGGLNDGNPNTDRTPAGMKDQDPNKPLSQSVMSMKHNYEDEVDGSAAGDGNGNTER